VIVDGQGEDDDVECSLLDQNGRRPPQDTANGRGGPGRRGGRVEWSVTDVSDTSTTSATTTHSGAQSPQPQQLPVGRDDVESSFETVFHTPVCSSLSPTQDTSDT